MLSLLHVSRCIQRCAQEAHKNNLQLKKMLANFAKDSIVDV